MIYAPGDSVLHHSTQVPYKVVERYGDSYIVEGANGGHVTFRGFELSAHETKEAADARQENREPRDVSPGEQVEAERVEGTGTPASSSAFGSVRPSAESVGGTGNFEPSTADEPERR